MNGTAHIADLTIGSASSGHITQHASARLGPWKKVASSGNSRERVSHEHDRHTRSNRTDSGTGTD